MLVDSFKGWYTDFVSCLKYMIVYKILKEIRQHYDKLEINFARIPISEKFFPYY
jgi:hypothetical protein